MEKARLDKIIADRVGNKGVGFNSEIAGPTSVDENDLLRQVLPQDRLKFLMHLFSPPAAMVLRIGHPTRL